MPRIFEDPFTLDALAFNTGVADADGATWYCDGLEGWEDGVEPDAATTSFDYSDGVEVADRFPIGARFVELGGAVVADNRAAAIAAWRKLQLALRPDTLVTATRSGPLDEMMEVRRVGTLHKPKDLGHAFRFQATLLSPWPYKVSTALHSAEVAPFTGLTLYRTYNRIYPLTYTELIDTSPAAIPTSATITNEGTADAFPIFELDGPLLSGTWFVENNHTGEWFTFNQDVNTGATLIIDSRRQTAQINGVSVEYNYRGDWLSLPPQEPSLLRLVSNTSNPDPSTRMRIYVRDTYM